MKATATKFDYAVLIYPPHGVPRVIEMPHYPRSVSALRPPCEVFRTREKAAAALEKFLTENPEYRRWRDGRIQED